jgi:uncharacterized surface protein with fasciclin (FAS1) repeats
MTRILLKTIWVTTFSSLLFISQMEAYCARCMKIEEERAKEQAVHPQTLGYYDGQISLHVEDNLVTKNDSHLSKDLSQTESGALSGSTYQSTEVNTSSNFRDYSMLYTIIKTKNFLETLAGNFTLFIPTNKALQQLQPEALIGLTQSENAEKLAALVSHHVVAKRILRSDFINNNNLEVKAISGRNLTLSYKNGNLYIDNILILRAEPAGLDGVIYIIDKVLAP